jgi:hypothetical protein
MMENHIKTALESNLVKKISKDETVLGPTQLTLAVNRQLKSISIDEWKNIPVPLCESTNSLKKCINDIKKFVIFMDTRFTNLSTSTASATIENGNLVENFKKDAKETIDAIETKLLTKLGLMEEGLKSSSDRMEARIL